MIIIQGFIATVHYHINANEFNKKTQLCYVVLLNFKSTLGYFGHFTFFEDWIDLFDNSCYNLEHNFNMFKVHVYNVYLIFLHDKQFVNLMNN